MKQFMIVVAIIAVVFLFSKSIEHFRKHRNRSPPYCSGQNSCVGMGCTVDPNQPCNSTRTIPYMIPSTDMDWGAMLGGETIQVCTSNDGSVIDGNTCGSCSSCGQLVPPSGNLSASLCVPLTKAGCLSFAAPAALINYLNSNPDSISCCGN